MDRPAATVLPLKTWRVALVLTLIALLIAGHAWDVLAQREHWPFSYYPMYARVEKKRRITMLSLFGLVREPGKRALVRLSDPRYLDPMSEGRLRVILMAAYRRGDQPQNIAATKDVMRDFLRMYESRRIAGLHDGPPMTEVHLYRLTWKLRPDGSPSARPWKSEPLMSVTLGDLDVVRSDPSYFTNQPLGPEEDP